MQQLQQEDWIKQQIREKELYKENARQAAATQDELAKHYNQVLTETQEEHAAQRKAMFVATQQANLQLAKEKRDRDAKAAQDLQAYARTEVDFTLTHDLMTENPATEQSMLAPHRVKPYHFKGLNKEQQEAILHERAQQVREQKMLRETEKEAEQLWALQQEHTRRQQVLADRQMKRGLRAVEEGHRAYQEQQKMEHDETWRDHYEEKKPTHNNY